MIDFPQDENEIAQCIGTAIRATDVRLEDASFSFVGRWSGDNREFRVSQEAIRSLRDAISAKELADETALFSDLSFEIIVNEESPFPGRRIRGEQIRVSDAESGFTYEVSSASDEYLVWLIVTAVRKRQLRDLGFGMLPTRFRVERLLAAGQDGELTVLDLLRALSPRIVTVKLFSASRQTPRRFQTAIYSFLFHLAYNLDVALVPQRFFEELSRRGRISRIRRSTTGDLDPPRRSYNEDLVNHYILATSTDSPSVQFLSYYHILEHFFESVFNDDLIEQIKTTITQPSFSYKRKKDVAQLISTIKKSLQIRAEAISFSEIDALRLSLIKFVEIDQLVARIDEYDNSLVEYYGSTEVSFSKGSAVSLRSADRDRVVRDLAKRIYATRNALVHSKDGDKARYIPFKDERPLMMEIPLMRFIAEMVVLAVSEIA